MRECWHWYGWDFIQNQVNAARPTVWVQKSTQGWLEMSAVVEVQTLGPHPAVVDIEPGQQIERAMPNVLELLSLDLLALHPLCGGGPFQGLYPGLLIQRQYDFVALPPPCNSLVKPQDFEGSFDGSASQMVVFQ